VIYAQIVLNGLILGGMYTCIAVGFSLIWGVLNIINVLHGTFIIAGAFVSLVAYERWGIHPFVSALFAGALLFVVGYLLQRVLINRVLTASVLMTLTLTFGIDLILNNGLILAFSADYRKLNLANPLGNLDLAGITVSLDRLIAMALALLLTGVLAWLLKYSKMGRAIVAVRMDREAASLMGIDINAVNAVAFGIGALMAGAAGSLLSSIYPFSPLTSTQFLLKAFVVCVMGGLGGVGGALAGGIALGLLESVSGLFLSPEYALTFSFLILLLLIMFRPTGIMGKKGFE
jgi:branched-chain amino acid transport system permease protein